MNTPVSITLYGFVTSPYVQKVATYLTYKNLTYDFVNVDPVRPTQIRFSNQRKVPVLMIDNEWRTESSQIGMWMDEKFPEKPLLGRNNEERERILEIDRWVSETYIPSMAFRLAYEWQSIPVNLYVGWRLAYLLNQSRKLPLPFRVFWPLLIKKAGFIRDIVTHHVDLNEPIKEMRKRILGEVKQHLDGGPFLGGMQSPSLADLSLYPLMVTPYQVLPLKAMDGPAQALLPKDPGILAWLEAVHHALPRSPLLVKDHCIVRPLPFEK